MRLGSLRGLCAVGDNNTHTHVIDVVWRANPDTTRRRALVLKLLGIVVVSKLLLWSFSYCSNAVLIMVLSFAQRFGSNPNLHQHALWIWIEFLEDSNSISVWSRLGSKIIRLGSASQLSSSAPSAVPPTWASTIRLQDWGSQNFGSPDVDSIKPHIISLWYYAFSLRCDRWNSILK